MSMLKSHYFWQKLQCGFLDHTISRSIDIRVSRAGSQLKTLLSISNIIFEKKICLWMIQQQLQEHQQRHDQLHLHRRSSNKMMFLKRKKLFLGYSSTLDVRIILGEKICLRMFIINKDMIYYIYTGGPLTTWCNYKKIFDILRVHLKLSPFKKIRIKFFNS